MSKLMLIDATHPEEVRVVISERDVVQEYDYVTSTKQQVKGNIYLAKVTRVEPSLQAAFVDYGAGKQGFLPFSEIHPDYYHLPQADKEVLMEQVAEEQESQDQNAEISAAEIAETQAILEAEENGTDISAQPETSSDDHIDDSNNHDENHHETSSDNNDDAPPQDEQIETIAAEEEEISPRPRRYNFTKRYRINEVIKKGQVMLIQVIKEERGNKGAALTTYISLAGRYCVLMPNTSNHSGGISRKVTSSEDRSRLREVMDNMPVPDGMSVILRTAGADRSRAEIRRDFDYLIKLWEEIRNLTLASTAPAMVYEESDIIKRAIRDLYKTDIEHIVIDGEESYKNAKNFMKMLMPSHAPKVKQYNGDIPLFYAYDVEHQLLSMHDPVVRLRSGGYIVINQTEALVAIDVNSGKSTKERNVEETALKTNIEAAVEVARQLRLRDLAGLLVLDFIDMYEFRHRRMVERALKEALRLDRAKIQIGRISAFGLLEMSRQRIRPSIAETSSLACSHCNGTGVIRSVSSLAVQMLRMVEKEAFEATGGSVDVVAHTEVALYVLNNKRRNLQNLESKYNIRLNINSDSTLQMQHFRITRKHANAAGEIYTIDQDGYYIGRKPSGYKKPTLPVLEPTPVIIDDEAESPSSARQEEGQPRSARRRRKRGRGRRDEFEDNAVNTEISDNLASDDSAIAAADEAGNDNNDQPAEAVENGERRGRRRGRGLMRRRWNRDETAQRSEEVEFETTEANVQTVATSTAETTIEKPAVVEKPASENVAVFNVAVFNEPPPKPHQQPVPFLGAELEIPEVKRSNREKHQVTTPDYTVKQPDPNRPKRNGWWAKTGE